MRLTIRKQPVVKSIVYAILCLCLLLFSTSFFPALGLTQGAPCLLVAAVSALALFEGVRYASFFGLIFGVTEAFMLGHSTLLFPLFYVAFALCCAWMFENFFLKNFVSWFGYTLGGIVIYQGLTLFAPVSDWNITAADLFFYTTLPSLILSVAFSLPLHPIFAKIKKKTD